MRHFLSINQFSNEEIYRWLQTAELYRLEKSQSIHPNPLFVANLFFEPSTRTKMSFTVAQQRMGMHILDFHNETSSAQKGESLYDTAKTFEAIGANAIVIRHESDNWYQSLEGKLSIPMINAGAGKAEHPTQCMLDLLTIYQEFANFKGLRVAIVGDIKHSRVAKSNAETLKRLGAQVFLCAAPGFEDTSLEYPYIAIDEAVSRCDVVMLLRIQHERHSTKLKTNAYLEDYGLTKERERKMKDHAIILHPAPVNRGVEMDTDLVECARSRIFKQMENGVYVRMAIMQHVLQEWGMMK